MAAGIKSVKRSAIQEIFHVFGGGCADLDRQALGTAERRTSLQHCQTQLTGTEVGKGEVVQD